MKFGAVEVAQQRDVSHWNVVPAPAQVASEHVALHAAGSGAQLKPPPDASHTAQSPAHAPGTGTQMPAMHWLHVPSHGRLQQLPSTHDPAPHSTLVSQVGAASKPMRPHAATTASHSSIHPPRTHPCYRVVRAPCRAVWSDRRRASAARDRHAVANGDAMFSNASPAMKCASSPARR